MAEEVLVCRSELLRGAPEYGLWQDVALLDGVLRQAEFLPRAQAEHDPAYKQIIPYVILRHGEQVFRYRRTQQGKEKRLRGLASIGVGGHVNRSDVLPLLADAVSIIEWARDRELREEFDVGSARALRLVGLLNDDHTEVGRVHFGVVYEYWLHQPNVTSRELGRHEMCSFCAIPVLRAERAGYETWSQLLIDQYL